MAARKKSAKDAPSFQAIVQAARERRRKQDSTDEFFNKRAAPGGIRKAEPTRTTVTARRATREARLLSSALPEPDLNIKGRAMGPTAVLGSNFAPGTTAEDIQSAFEPVGGRMLRCRLVSTYPAVMAEMMFADRRGADDVVAKFNNQKVN
ncbi:predicted protein [Uncinocarpus reesii 1704]|uniref:RRM domain-containing protein n=1 Tax=Uncinocarpus reesii (strain UAMH 1704) TaxID=336963 RepID=C4JKL7_UNCRE|nr:uncharacterized protein UREG_02174 [Uncinocarpus reesii 1704]EEP77325.1 predicted protein [Uncinocarpus reesii 1704]